MVGRLGKAFCESKRLKKLFYLRRGPSHRRTKHISGALQEEAYPDIDQAVPVLWIKQDWIFQKHLRAFGTEVSWKVQDSCFGKPGVSRPVRLVCFTRGEVTQNHLSKTTKSLGFSLSFVSPTWQEACETLKGGRMVQWLGHWLRLWQTWVHVPASPGTSCMTLDLARHLATPCLSSPSIK